MATNVILFTTIGTGSFVKPQGVKTIFVECWGAGGNGGNGGPVGVRGSGGGGGAYAAKIINYTSPQQTINYEVGQPVGINASSRTLWQRDPNNQNTPLVLAWHGGDGSTGGAGGIGGFYGNCNGDIRYSGGNGSTRSSGGGYGGGGAGSTGPGKDAVTDGSPGGATSEYGGMGSTGDNDDPGATLYGGGGAGGQANYYPATEGAQGLIRITYDDPNGSYFTGTNTGIVPYIITTSGNTQVVWV